MEASRRAPSRVVVDQVGVVDLYERGRVRHGTQRHRLTCGMHIPSCARTDQQQSRACRRASRGALSGSFSSHWTSWCPTSLLRFLNLCRLSFNLVPPRERRPAKTRQKRRDSNEIRASHLQSPIAPTSPARRAGGLVGISRVSPSVAQGFPRAAGLRSGSHLPQPQAQLEQPASALPCNRTSPIAPLGYDRGVR